VRATSIRLPREWLATSPEANRYANNSETRVGSGVRARRQRRMSPGAGIFIPSISRPDEPPSSATETIAVTLPA